MKLCRFELKSEPGMVRSGMVYSGKIYETSGAEAIAVHEAEDVRPLSPIPHAPTVRVFRSDLQQGVFAGLDAEEPSFFYVNPTTLFGASQVLPFPDSAGEVGFECYLAAVAVSDAHQLPLENADQAILGYTLMTLVVGRGWEASERRAGALGRSHDLGGVIGPVITTPDELEEHVVDSQYGTRFDLEAVVRINQVEQARGNLSELPFSAAQALSGASMTAPVRAGDILALGPIVSSERPLSLDPGDEVQIAVQSLGTLSLKLSMIL